MEEEKRRIEWMFEGEREPTKRIEKRGEGNEGTAFCFLFGGKRKQKICDEMKIQRRR